LTPGNLWNRQINKEKNMNWIVFWIFLAFVSGPLLGAVIKFGDQDLEEEDAEPIMGALY
jgi:hypothetical protein